MVVVGIGILVISVIALLVAPVLVWFAWNVLDFGYGAEQLIQMVDSGLLGGCYMSTSYLTGLVPRLEVFDLPFLINSRRQAFDVP